MKPYVYHPLQRGEIRLFDMDPSSPSEQVTGKLRTGCLDEGNGIALSAYTALSYAWGATYPNGSHLTDSIICDGCQLKVTANLKQAPVRIRHVGGLQQPYDPSLLSLCIDAMCINQCDLSERTEQVNQMAMIYRSSSRLLIWLGELSPGHLGDRQFAMLRRSHGCTTNMMGIAKQDAKRHSALWILSGQFSKIKEFKKSRNMSETQVLNTILDRSWFHRRWVLQECEMVRPERTYFLMGEAICHRENFRELLSRNNKLDSAPPLQTSARRGDALQVCHYYELSECSDPRDFIFAITHLCSNGFKINVDYNQDVRDTYLSFVKSVALGLSAETEFDLAYQILRRPERVPDIQILRMLALAACRKDSTYQPPIEKWVADWKARPSYDSYEHKRGIERCMGGPFDLAGRMAWTIEVAPNGYHYFWIRGILLNRFQVQGRVLAASSCTPSTAQEEFARFLWHVAWQVGEGFIPQIAFGSLEHLTTEIVR